MSYKLLTYIENGAPVAGLLVAGRVHELARAAADPAYASVIGVLRDWGIARDRLATFAATLERDGEGGRTVETVQLCAPIPHPGQVYGVGSNYSDHRSEMAKPMNITARVTDKSRGDLPWFFIKAQACVVGPGAVTPAPGGVVKFDWEVELAVVIGKRASRIEADRALDHVAGYTIANDLSARDLARRPNIPPDSPFAWDHISAKCFEGSCPMGPWITPASDVPDPQDLGLRLMVNDEIMQDGRTSSMIFGVAEQVAALSHMVPLMAGDVILTGTPSGTGMGRGIFLKHGDRLALEIERIGRLEHSIALDGGDR